MIADSGAHAYWDRYGTSDLPLIDVTSEALARGEASWPAGWQRYRVVRTWQSLVLSSEGLGDPELYLEMPGAQGWLPAQVRTQWQFDVLRSVCRVIRETGLTPAQAPVVVPVPAPAHAPLQLYSQLSGALVLAVVVGITVPGRPTGVTADNTAAAATYLPVTPITAREFAHITAGGHEALERVIAGRVAGGFHHVVIDSEAVTGQLDAQLPED